MIGPLCFVLAVLASPFKSKLRLEAENAVLRHQLNVVRRRLPGRVQLTNNDRWFLIQLSFARDRCVRAPLYNTTTERPRDRGGRASLSVASLGRMPGRYSRGGREGWQRGFPVQPLWSGIRAMAGDSGLVVGSGGRRRP